MVCARPSDVSGRALGTIPCPLQTPLLTFALGLLLPLADHRGLGNCTWLGLHEHPFWQQRLPFLRAGDEIHNVVVEGMTPDASGSISATTTSRQEYGAVTYILKKTDTCPSDGAAGKQRGERQRVWCALHSLWSARLGNRGCIQVGPQQQKNRAQHDWDTRGAVSISSATIHEGYNAAIQLDRVHGATIDHNLIYRVQRVGIKVEGQRNIVHSNLVVRISDSFDKDNGAFTIPWTTRWQAGKFYTLACTTLAAMVS